ncbi:MAG: autotransporter translocation and assembly module inner membrane component TamB [Rhodobacteraceae bacterium HLUCCA12]|nr:MAG: autotransporter translocation and assembly module inner membrane component TamB [Rhodobacteraceae bacterium HLUCCA12]
MRGFVPLAAALLLIFALMVPPALSQQADDAQDDVGLLAGLLQSYLSDAGREVSIRGFQGALSSRATIRRLSIADDEGTWLILRDIVLDWNRAALFDRRVAVNELSAGRIELLRLPSTGDDDGLPSPTARAEFNLPELPVSVNIGELRADEVVIDESVTGQRAALTLEGAMQLSDGEGTASFEARRTDGQEGTFRFSGVFDNTSRNLSLDLVLSEGPEGIAASLLNIPDRPALALMVAGEGPIDDFEAEIGLSSDGQERVSGTVQLTDATPQSDLPDGLHFIADIAGDLRPLMAEEMHPFFGSESRLRAQGARADDGAISLYELTFNTRTARLVGRADFGSDGLPRVVDLIADVAREDGEPVALPGGDGEITLDEAALDIAYDASQSRDWLITAGIDGLNTVQGAVERLDLDARGRLAPPGTDDEPGPLFEGVFDFAALGIDAADPAMQQAIGDSVSGFMSMEWPGMGEPAQITGLGVEGDTAALSAYGTLDGTTFDGFIEAEAPDLSDFSGLAGRSLAGHALFSSTGQANLLTGALDLELGLRTTDLSVDQREFDNLVAGEASIRADVIRDQLGTILRDFSLSAGALELRAAGQHLPGDIHVYTSAEIADLGALGPGYGGAMSLDTRLQSDEERQSIRLDATAQDLALGDLPGAEAVSALFQGRTEIMAEADMDGDRITVRDARIDGPQIAFAVQGLWSDAETDMSARLSRLDIDGVLPGASGRLAGQAAVTGDDTARRIDLDLASDGRLRTGMSEIDGLIGDRLALDLAVILGADNAVAIEAAELRTQALTASANGRQGADGAADFELTGAVDSLGRAVPGLDGEARLQASLARAAGEESYATRFSFSGPSGLTMNGNGRVRDDFSDLDLDLDGEVDAAIANPLIRPFTVQGAVRLDARVDGPPAIGSLRGQAVVSGGRFVAPDDNVAFGNIEGSAELMGQWAQVELTGEAETGGRASISGGVGLNGRRDVDLGLSAERLRIVRPRLLETVVSGDVRLMGDLATGPRLSGTVQVDEAEIRIPNSPLGRSGHVPVGLRHVGESGATRRTRENAGVLDEQANGRRRVPIYLDLELDAPGRVFVRGRGLDAELGGTLRLGGSTADVIPSGSFGLIRGRLDLLGNRFSLTDGSASMTGSFMPYVRLVATTDSDGVTTSIILEGEALEPDISFTSVPELPEDEVLARLIFRRALSSLSPFQAAQLAMSVATLTGHSEGSFLTRTRETLGLDDLDVTTDEDGNTALRAGRYLSENLYTDLSVDSAGRGEVSINLDLTPSVTLRGRTDTEGRAGVGVFYERDY